MIAHSTDKFIVVPHEGRFVVAKRAAGSLSEYHVVDDCRTKAFADARAEALNEGKVVI
jgi:hypothetical protein